MIAAARNELVMRNRGLVGLAVRKLGRRAVANAGGPRDAWQVGCVGLILAAERYEASRGAFSTYAMNMICWQIIRAARDGGLIRTPRLSYRRPNSRYRQARAAAYRVEGGLGTDLDADVPCPRHGDPAEAAEHADDLAWLRRVVSRLPPQWADVIRRVDFGGETMTAVAADEGVTKQAVQLRRQKALARLAKFAGY